MEVHSETHLAEGGPRRAALATIARRLPLSCHSVGLSLGGAEAVDATHIQRLRRLYDEVRPAQISDHLAWSRVDGHYLNDLLPFPLTPESLDRVADNVARAQDGLGRRLLVENPSGYLPLPSTIPEAAFLAEVVRRTGCGLLLDVANVVVSAHNLDRDPHAYLADYDLSAVGEIHVAGHRLEDWDGHPLLIDDHASAVPNSVWALTATVLARTGPLPVLVEWDRDIPDLSVLLEQAARAQALLDALPASGGA